MIESQIAIVVFNDKIKGVLSNIDNASDIEEMFGYYSYLAKQVKVWCPEYDINGSEGWLVYQYTVDELLMDHPQVSDSIDAIFFIDTKSKKVAINDVKNHTQEELGKIREEDNVDDPEKYIFVVDWGGGNWEVVD